MYMYMYTSVVYGTALQLTYTTMYMYFIRDKRFLDKYDKSIIMKRKDYM